MGTALWQRNGRQATLGMNLQAQRFGPGGEVAQRQHSYKTQPRPTLKRIARGESPSGDSTKARAG
jgi:hypothetical protein